MYLVSQYCYIIFKLTLANDIHAGDQIPPTAASSRTLKTRCSEMCSVLSAGEPTALIQKEVLTLSDDER